MHCPSYKKSFTQHAFILIKLGSLKAFTLGKTLGLPLMLLITLVIMIYLV